MKIGFSFWGYCSEYYKSVVKDTPDGGRFTRKIFVKELLSRNIDVVFLQEKRDAFPLNAIEYDSAGFPKIDVLFIEWRWPTWKNDKNNKNYVESKYEPDLDRQNLLLEHYYNKVPIVVWDTDLKVTEEDMKNFKNVFWCDPCFKPRSGFTSMPYFTDYYTQLFDIKQPNRMITYVGSNYERYWAVEKYYYNIGKNCRNNGINIEFFGNWLTPSPERPEQDEIVRKYSEFINFNKRNNFLEGMSILNKSICTTHIIKKLYCEHQLVTPRFFESLASNTIGFVLEELNMDLYGKEFIADENIFDKINSVANISINDRIKIINKQRKHIQVNFPETQVNNFVSKFLKEIGVN